MPLWFVLCPSLPHPRLLPPSTQSTYLQKQKGNMRALSYTDTHHYFELEWAGRQFPSRVLSWICLFSVPNRRMCREGPTLLMLNLKIKWNIRHGQQPQMSPAWKSSDNNNPFLVTWQHHCCFIYGIWGCCSCCWQNSFIATRAKKKKTTTCKRLEQGSLLRRRYGNHRYLYCTLQMSGFL